MFLRVFLFVFAASLCGIGWVVVKHGLDHYSQAYVMGGAGLIFVGACIFGHMLAAAIIDNVYKERA